MRVFVLPVAAIALIGTSNPPVESEALANLAETQSLDALNDFSEVHGTQCQDRIRQAREASGQPILDREAASPERPLLIWAVDRREGSCGVMVMKGDLDDIREVPAVEDKQGFEMLIPADSASGAGQ